MTTAELKARLERRAKILDALDRRRGEGTSELLVRSIESAVLDVELMDLEAASRLEEIRKC